MYADRGLQQTGFSPLVLLWRWRSVSAMSQIGVKLIGRRILNAMVDHHLVPRVQPRAKLIAGPYTPPNVKPGDWLYDEIDGLLVVGGWTDGPIPWPRRKKNGRASLILSVELVRAVRAESVQAICQWWGVGQTKVWVWRRSLDVGRVTHGTRLLLQENTGVPAEAAARGRVAASSPESIAKMANTKRGVPAPPSVRSGLLQAAKAPKPEGWGLKANKWLKASKEKPE